MDLFDFDMARISRRSVVPFEYCQSDDSLKMVLKGILLISLLIRSFGVKSVTGPLFNMKYELVSCYIG